MFVLEMKLPALPLTLLLLLLCRTALTTFTKSHLTQCKYYYDMYSQVHETTLRVINLCSLKCYMLGESCPRFYYDTQTKVCKLSVLNSAGSVRKPVQYFTRNFEYKVSE